MYCVLIANIIFVTKHEMKYFLIGAFHAVSPDFAHIIYGLFDIFFDKSFAGFEAKIVFRHVVSEESSIQG